MSLPPRVPRHAVRGSFRRRGSARFITLCICLATVLGWYSAPLYALSARSDEVILKATSPLREEETPTLQNLIPKPVSVEAGEGTFPLTVETTIRLNDPSLQSEGEFLASHLRPASGFPLTVEITTDTPVSGSIYLLLEEDDLGLGDEGYELTIQPQKVELRANHAAGIFRGIQTLRQLLPAAIERSTIQTGSWTLPAAVIRDHPRFAWRGAMLDVARHFFPVDVVKHYLDWMAYYKLNRLHLHLADDQGWRIMIDSWPNLTAHGGSTAVGSVPGGFYTKADYAEIVAYAERMHIIVVPEIDMPGHTNAALASYPELNCDGKAPALYTGMEVGFSSLCISKEITYTFIEDVIRELVALTPGPYLHIGGDEAAATPDAEYVLFVERVQAIVAKYGKQIVGWEEIAQTQLMPGTLVQHWNSTLALKGVQQGAKVIMSPASRAYLDMKYTATTSPGLDWAGLIEVQTGYTWDPTMQLRGLAEADIIGIEAPLWTETITNLDEITVMAFPRLVGHAEIGWSPVEGRAWEEYKVRLQTHYARFEALGITFYRSPQVP